MRNKKLSSIFAIGLSLVSFASSPASAQEVKGTTTKALPLTSPDQTTLGVRLGMVNVSNLNNGLISYGAYGDQTVSDNFLIGGSVDFWSLSTGGLSESAVAINDVAIGGNGKFIFTNARATFKPYALAGLALHRISISEGELVDGNSPLNKYREKNNDVSTQASIDLGAGALYNVQRQVDVNGLLVYRQMASSGANFNQFGLSAGVGYRM